MSGKSHFSSPHSPRGDSSGSRVHTLRRGPSPARLVSVAHDRPEASQIAAKLIRLGGVRIGFSDALLYAFPSESSRRKAIKAVRSVHGWTCVDPQG